MTENLNKTRSEEDVKKIAKRITMLMRELEVHSMDMVMYSKQLADGKFPKTHLVQVENALVTATKELTRIQQAWTTLFKADIDGTK